MNERIGIDASGLFAFFQMQNPGSNVSTMTVSQKVRKVYYEFLLKQLDLVIPVPALSELMYKAFIKGRINDYNNILAVYQSMDNVFLVDWEFDVLEQMGHFLAMNENKVNTYFREVNRKPEIFDLTIFQCCKSEDVTRIVSKDEVFDKLYKMERIW